MIKHSKRFIYLILTLISLMIIVNNVNLYNQTYTPSSNGTQIQIDQWDEKVSKKDIIDGINEFGQKTNQKIFFISSYFDNDKEIKVIYPFENEYDKKNFSYVRSTNIKTIDQKQMLLQNICGQFIISGDETKAQEFIQFLSTKGITGEVIEPHIFQNFSLIDISPQIVFTLILIIILLVVLNLFEKITECKKYGILILNGAFGKQVWELDFKKELNYLIKIDLFIVIISNLIALFYYQSAGMILFNEYLFTLLFIISMIYLLANAVSYIVIPLIDVKLAIKDGMPSRWLTCLGYLLKIAILFILAINTYNITQSVQQYQSNQEILNIWNNQDNAYVISILGQNYTDKQEEKIGQATKKLLSTQPYILAKNNELLYHPSTDTISVDEGNVMIVNPNYLKQSTSLNNKNSQSINVLIPKEHSSQKTEIQQEVKNYLNFQQELPNIDKKVNYSLKTSIIPNQTSVFNWNIGDNLADSMSHNPIFVVVNLNQLSDNFYYSSLTNKQIIFNDLSSLKKNINQSGLSQYVAGITSLKSSVSQLNQKNKMELAIIIITSLISLLQAISVMVFIFSTFMERNKKRIALNIVHGLSNHHLLLQYLMLNVSIDLGVWLLSTIYYHNATLLITGLSLTILEVVGLLIINQHYQKQSIKILNNGY